MTKLLRQSEIEEILADLGLKRPMDIRIGAAIALCEAPVLERAANGEFQSNFSAIGDQELADEIWGYSYGGFQIRSVRNQKGTGGIRDEEKLVRPRFNCRSAIAIKRVWGGWGAWSTYNSGMYKAYLQDLYPPLPGTYVVVGGDNIVSITNAISYGEWTWEDLARVNNLHAPYTIYIGQHLILP
jgi:Lysozyme like domain/LysM domain